MHLSENLKDCHYVKRSFRISIEDVALWEESSTPFVKTKRVNLDPLRYQQNQLRDKTVRQAKYVIQHIGSNNSNKTISNIWDILTK